MSIYSDKFWMARRKYQLQQHPFCKMCLEDGRYVAATVVDHVVPHKGNQRSFLMGEIQSLCVLHHDSSKKRIEARGYDNRIGTDGMPVDGNHPWYKLRKYG